MTPQTGSMKNDADAGGAAPARRFSPRAAEKVFSEMIHLRPRRGISAALGGISAALGVRLELRRLRRRASELIVVDPRARRRR